MGGFNVVQVFCCNDMVNLLTDRGNVYASLFDDLQLHQKRVLVNKSIIKITGCPSENKCVAISDDGQIFEWYMATETLGDETEDTTDDADKSDENEDNSENSLVVNSISDAIPLSEIDQKIIDVAITSTAYAAITMSKELIIWGDYSKMYSENEDNANDKSKKKIKKTKPKKNDNPKDEEENKEPAKAYVVVKTHNESIEKNESETEAEGSPKYNTKNLSRAPILLLFWMNM